MTILTILTILSFLKSYWKLIVIVALFITVILCLIKLDNKDKEISKIEVEHEVEILTINNKNLETVVKLKDEVLKTNNKVNEVVNDYHTAIKKQSERTKEIHKEVQTFIPSIVRESCDFSPIWMLNTNKYISSSNSNTSTNDPK